MESVTPGRVEGHGCPAIRTGRRTTRAKASTASAVVEAITSPRVLAAACLAIAGGFALAVEQEGSIDGFALREGAPVAGVAITATGPDLQGERHTVTDSRGYFVLHAVPPGTYRLRAVAPDLVEGVREGVEVRLGRTTRVEIAVVRASLVETVTVRAETPLIDTVRTTSQHNYDREYLERSTVGLEGRRYQSVLAHAPGAVGGLTPRVRGSSGFENVYLIDGVDTTDPLRGAFGTHFAQDAIEEIQYQTGGFPAEFGRATGGISNVRTRSGGNTITGSVDLRYGATDMMESGDHFDPDTDGITTRRLEGTLGGPIRRDRLWFFLAASDAQVPNPLVEGATSSEVAAEFYLGKLTWRVGRAHDLTFQASGGPIRGDRLNLGPLVPPEATDRHRYRLATATVRYVGSIGPGLLVEAQASTFRADSEIRPQSGDLDTPGQIDLFSGGRLQNGLEISDETQDRDQIAAAVTWMPAAVSSGHTLKFGFDYQSLNREKSFAYPGGELQWVVPNANGDLVPYAYGVPTGVTESMVDGRNGAVFAQDQWRVSPRVTLNLGLRYETVEYDNEDGRRVFETSLPQPRLGVAWDVAGDGRSALKLFAGRYMHPAALRLPLHTNRIHAVDLFFNEAVAGYLFGLGPVPVDINRNGVIEERVFTNSLGGIATGSTADDGDLEAPNVVEVSASYERRLGAGAVIGLTLVRRETHDILESVEDPEENLEVLDNLPLLERSYEGAELRFEGHWRWFHARASYTASRSKGHVNRIWGVRSDFDYPEMSVNRYGYLDDDARHAFKLHGYTPLPAGFEIGYGLLYHSGFPYTKQRYLVEEYGYGFEFLEPRGSRRLPSYRQLDLEARKHLDVDFGKLTFMVSVLNVLDEQAVVDVSEREESFEEPLLWQQPRRYEVGLRYAF